jgi:hypothetical protein
MIYSGVCVGGGGGGPWGRGFKNCGFADFFKLDRKSDCACSHRVFFLWFRLFSILCFFVALQFPMC